MRLRNKKTGVIVEAHLIIDEPGIRRYADSIKDLCNNYEDYQPAEPLIKDEKIRKAVKVWAEAFKIEKVYFDAKMLRFYDRKSKFIISIGYPIIGIWDKKDGYTIAELCGEEEE